MSQSALLLHIPPAAQPHLDWLLPHANANPEQPLITFRIARLPTDLPPGLPLPATRIHDHRPHYLTFQGPLTDNRGIVRRIASPDARMLEEAPDRLRFTADWGDGSTLWTATRSPDTPPGEWVLLRHPNP